MPRKGLVFEPKRVLAALGGRLRPPIGIALGSPREVAELVAALQIADTRCFQMDLFQAERVREEFASHGITGEVHVLPDLWDMPTVETLIYPAAEAGDRELKLDIVEQAFHALRPRGTFAVSTTVAKDQLFPAALKKVFGHHRAPADGQGLVFLAQRDGERPRRRHEVTFQIREGGGSLRFLSRPGTFAYGRFDNGARALVESMHVEPGNRVLDLGCGCGTNGVIAGLRTGGFTLFVDSNVRAVQLAEHNARENGLVDFKAVASANVEGFPDANFDVVLANPPYYAQFSIARLFIEKAHARLRKGGVMYLVTKQVREVAPMIEEVFGNAESEMRRSYMVFRAIRA